jgi:hypothetical protein
MDGPEILYYTHYCLSAVGLTLVMGENVKCPGVIYRYIYIKTYILDLIVKQEKDRELVREKKC